MGEESAPGSDHHPMAVPLEAGCAQEDRDLLDPARRFQRIDVELVHGHHDRDHSLLSTGSSLQPLAVEVALSQLEAPGGEGQLSLLESGGGTVETERDRVISRVIDEVRQKFGRDALGRGGAQQR